MGFSLKIALVHKPSLQFYWSTLSITPFFAPYTSRNCFLLLQRMLHFNDNSAALPQDCPDQGSLLNIRPILGHMSARFPEICTLGKNIAIDEFLILYKGRLLFRQNIQSRRASYGIKLYMLFESSAGYVYCLRM